MNNKEFKQELIQELLLNIQPSYITNFIQKIKYMIVNHTDLDGIGAIVVGKNILKIIYKQSNKLKNTKNEEGVI